MADAPRALDASTRAALDKLADLAVPAPAPWFPQTWGWAAIGIVLVALVVWALVHWRRRHQANRYRVEALAELARLEAWPEAKANLALVQRLIPKEKKKDDESEGEPNEKPDQIQFDDKGKKGKTGQVDVAKQTAEMWMRNIQLTPRDLLQRKFALETRRGAVK